MSKTGKEFLTEISAAAQRVCGRYGLRASVCIAQALLESDWGEHAIATYNVFGRKWVKTGNYIELPTKEFINGKWITVSAKFRKYDSYDEALTSYCELISHAPYQAVKPNYANLEAYVRELGKMYATDPNYATKILNIIKMNNLTQFDV
jgi:flagellum-specific peptidoglycan hydrolase FlgJ